MRRLATDLAVKQLKFLGIVPEEDPPEFYASADVFVTRSRFETFGVMFAQANRRGHFYGRWAHLLREARRASRELDCRSCR